MPADRVFTRALVAAAVAAALPAAPAASLGAQTTVAISGRVTATGNQPLADAQVVVVNRETAQQRGTRTTANGSYTVVGLSPGTYEVRVQRVGFAPFRQDVRLVIGQRATLDVELQERAAELTGVQVSADRPRATFEAQRTDVSAPVVQTEIENLPLNTRNTLNLAAIVPGIKTFAPTAGRSLPAAGAAPDLRFYNFYLDGVEWKSMFNGNLVGIPQTGSPIPQEALREFRVHLNPYDAELTRGGSFIISAVTHQGTNEWHGSAFVYGQNNSLRALEEFQLRQRAANPTGFRRADYDRQQLGFNVRGPLARNKLFLAASYELNNTTDVISVIPSPPANNPARWNDVAGNFSAPTRNHTGVARLTAPLSEKHTLDAIWAGRFYDSETFYGGLFARSAGLNAQYQVHSVQLRDTYTPTGSFVNQFSLHLLTWDHNESPLVAGPARVYPGATLGRNNFPLVLKERHMRAINKATYTLPGGRHVLKGGAELTRVSTSSFLPTNQNGLFEYRADTDTLPFRATIAVGFFNPLSTDDARAKSDGWVAGAYLQDEWQATDDLSLTLGLRYDAEINTLNNNFLVPWANDTALRRVLPAEFLSSGSRKNDLNNLSPRVAFSWDVFGDDRTFLRGGYGVMFGRVPSTYAFTEKQGASWRSYQFANPGTNDPDALRARVIAGGAALTPAITLLSAEIEAPETHQISAGIGRVLTPTLVANLDYVGQMARKLYVSRVGNLLTNGARPLTPRFANITVWDDVAEASFQALTAGLTWDKNSDPRRSTRLSLAYTLGFYESEFEGLGGYSLARPGDFRMQPTTGDERHRVVLSGIAPLPLGFQLSGIAIAATPRPFEVVDGRDLNGNSITTDDWADADRVTRPATTWANMYRTVDLRLAKSVSFGGQRAQVSAEVFNLFNWDNWASFGGARFDQRGTARLDFGRETGNLAPRQAQLGVRYEF